MDQPKNNRNKPTRRRRPPPTNTNNVDDNNIDSSSSNITDDFKPVLVDPNNDWHAVIEQAATPTPKVVPPSVYYQDAKRRPKDQAIRRNFRDRSKPKRIPSDVAELEAQRSSNIVQKKKNSLQLTMC